MPSGLRKTNSNQANIYIPHNKKEKKQELSCDKNLINRATELFNASVKSFQKNSTPSSYHNIHNQTKIVKEALIHGDGPADLILTLQELQKITNPDNRSSGKSPGFGFYNLSNKVNTLAQKGLQQAAIYN
ncbi:MAG: hypothetical protein V4489_02440 [Chlamydiota bacterium]